MINIIHIQQQFPPPKIPLLHPQLLLHPHPHPHLSSIMRIHLALYNIYELPNSKKVSKFNGVDELSLLQQNSIARSKNNHMIELSLHIYNTPLNC